MVIGIDIRSLMDRHYSGISLYTLELLRALFAQDTVNEYRLFYNAFKDKSVAVPEFTGPNVTLVKTRYPNKLLNYGLFGLLGRPRMDTVLGADIFFMPHINLLALSSACPRAVVVHDLSFLRYPYFFTARKNLWHRALRIRRVLSRATRIIAVSCHTKQDIIELCGIAQHKIKTVYSGISPSYFPRDLSGDVMTRVRSRYGLPPEYILYLGNIEPRKNIESIIEAYGLWRRHEGSRSVKLVIAGAFAWKHSVVKAMAKTGGYGRDIHFVGYVAETDKPLVYSGAMLFVFPSFYEGFGFPPLEAAACGTPVITSTTSSLPEVAGEFAILVNPYDVNEIARAMQEVLADERLRHELSRRGIEAVKKYTWEKTAKAVLEIFRELAP